jgi:hypothetical protein
MQRTVSGKPGKGADAGRQKRKSGRGTAKRPKPTKGAPFGVDVLNDGDIVSPRRDLSEDEIKEQEDRRS